MNDGHTWTTLHAMVWQILRDTRGNTAYWRAYLKVKGKDQNKWPDYPWSESDKGAKQYGKVADGDQDDAVAYLMSLSPTPTQDTP